MKNEIQTIKPTKKMLSILISKLTALSKPKDDFGLEQWQQIEFRKSKRDDYSSPHHWRSL